MKKFLLLFLISLSIFVVGCNENPLPTSDTTLFEKRTPIQKDTVKRRIPIEKVLQIGRASCRERVLHTV
jgi:hypothetical protein